MKMAAETSTKDKKSRSNKRMSGDRSAPSKGEQAKARIISVAEALFNKQGFDGASMRDIAAAAEMQAASNSSIGSSMQSPVRQILGNVWKPPASRIPQACSTGGEQTKRFSSCRRGITRRVSRQESSHCGTNTRRSS